MSIVGTEKNHRLVCMFHHISGNLCFQTKKKRKKALLLLWSDSGLGAISFAMIVFKAFEMDMKHGFAEISWNSCRNPKESLLDK